MSDPDGGDVVSHAGPYLYIYMFIYIYIYIIRLTVSLRFTWQRVCLGLRLDSCSMSHDGVVSVCLIEASVSSSSATVIQSGSRSTGLSVSDVTPGERNCRFC